MKSRIIFIVSLFLMVAVMSAAYAQDFKGKLITVKENQRLSDIIDGGVRAALIVQMVNDIKNAYDLKPGMKLIIPDDEFIKKVKDLPVSEIMEKARDYKAKVPAAVVREAVDSLADSEKKKVDADEKAALEAQQKAMANMGMKSVGALKGVAPVESPRIFQFKRNDSPYKWEN